MQDFESSAHPAQVRDILLEYFGAGQSLAAV